MARGTKGSVPLAGNDLQEEMTVVVVKVKGVGDTLKKGFDAITAAFNSLGPVALPQPARHSNGTSPKQLGTALPEAEEHNEFEEIVAEENETLDASSATAGPKNSKPRAKPRFLDDFDLNQSAKPWKEFAAERAPSNDEERFLIAALWLAENGSTPEFAATHMFTLIRAMKWNEPADFTVPLRRMKSKHSYFTNPSPKKWKMTGPGVDAARSVPKAQS